ncbi:tRNA(His) guanylyltransferase Thg1 family protein [Clostridium sp. AF32-12BH]|uniref:tRNA(His) guanylyltransferase Thg1 family protein n=1 Tax=Clostridium sp. AF32-12BH TaxID=2292006 RepID=UPI000E528DA2|nr:tRNA(His) guanylyltransferase Thg1 family protein [Clostridium sp. AF32-12BH]RHP46963.1 hypothetical protein DWZ40_08645 [Clostridium sp. AF32-12BH]
MDTSDLAKRMKEYEARNRHYLQKRIPVIIRLDMRSGHAFTKGFERPFDEIFITAMQETAKYLCANIQGCKLSYQQSDEISLVLVDYDDINTDCFFDYREDKLCSISASMATMAFNKAFQEAIDCAYLKEFHNINNTQPFNLEACENLQPKYKKYHFKVGKAMFDARCFNIPKEEVTNCLYWRQLDSTKNSIQMVGQANFSHKELHGKSCNNIQDMLMTQKGINWNDFPTYQKRGSCCIRNYMVSEPDGCRMYDIKADEHEWIIDREVPIFKGEGRKYIDRLIYVGE